MKKIVIASNNAGKLREIRAILAPFGLDAVSQKEAGFDAEVEETGTTFAENAALKAHAVHEALHCAVIADDSGLLVDWAEHQGYTRTGLPAKMPLMPSVAKSCWNC